MPPIDICDTPPLVGVYGAANTGKTTDKIWSFPNAIHIASPGSYAPAVPVCGFKPKIIVPLDPTSADIAAVKLSVEAALSKNKGVEEIVIDDFSMVAHRTARLLTPKYRDQRQKYGAVRDTLCEVFDVWRGYGLAVVVDCHEDPLEFEQDSEGKPTARVQHIGMPDLPGRKASPDMVKTFDLFYRTSRDVSRTVWPYIYTGGPNGVQSDQWATKDRWDMMPKTGVLPVNMGEILRAAPFTYKPKRLPGMEWIESAIVKTIETTTSHGKPVREVVTHFANLLIRDNKPAWAVNWFVRDALDRWEIQAARAASTNRMLAALGIAQTPPAPAPTS